MPSVAELTEPYGNFMLSPRNGPGVCEICFNLTDGYRQCYACAHGELWLDAIAPISYSVGLEQLHTVLRSYKRLGSEIGRRLCVDIAAVLWRFLERHEPCIAAAAEAKTFDLIATIPSGDRGRDEHHPLRRIVGSLVGPTRGRHERLLERSMQEVPPHIFNAHKFAATRGLDGDSVLLVDDTLTTGASAQSAAATLKRAGADRVAVVVIGRYVNREWHENHGRLGALTSPYEWDRCVFCVDAKLPGPGIRTS